MTRNPDSITRIAELERDLSLLRAEIQNDRPALSLPPAAMVLVKTWTANPVDYPANGDRLPFVVADATFDDTGFGGGAATYTRLSLDYQRVGFALGGYLARDVPAVAFRRNRKWWLLPVGGGAEIIYGSIFGGDATFGESTISVSREDGQGTLTDVRWDIHGNTGDVLQEGTPVSTAESTISGITFRRLLTWPCA